MLNMDETFNVDEPFNSRIQFGCVPPGKRYQTLEDLSGGEKTMAALALLFAIQSYKQAPFVMMDEVDASLDEVNIDKLASFLRHGNGQYIVISLQDQLYSQASALVGINSKRDAEHFVSCVDGILDLDKYADNDTDVMVSPLWDPDVATGSLADAETEDQG